MKETIQKSALPNSKLLSHQKHEKISIIHSQFVQYGKNAREWMRKCEMLLPHIERERVWKKKGFSSIYEYAAKLAGMSRNKVDVTLWTMRKIEDKSEILKIVESKGLNAVKPIANIITLENQNFWAEKANEMSVHTLETYAREYKKQFNNKENKPEESFHVERKVIGMELEMKVLEELEQLKGKEDWNTLMKEFIKLRKEKLEAEKPKTVKKEDKFNNNSFSSKPYRSRTAPSKIKKYVIEKTNGQCAFPGCKKIHKILHHTDRFSLNREHNPNTIVPLCKEHERIAHLGLIENENRDPANWKIAIEANKSSPTYQIDLMVQKYRQKST